MAWRCGLDGRWAGARRSAAPGGRNRCTSAAGFAVRGFGVDGMTRREWMLGAAAAASVRIVRADAPASRVAVARCKTYDPAELAPAMKRMFDQLGGLGRLVAGKTVAIKVNLTGAPTYR